MVLPRNPEFSRPPDKLPYDPEVPLSGGYPKELKTGPQKSARTHVFTTALFTTAQWLKQPKHPSADQ